MANDEIIHGLNDAGSIEEMRRRHLDVALRMQKLACIALEEWERKAARGEPLNMTGEDAKALFDVGVKIERAALGKKEPDDGDAAAPIPKATKPN
jgi:hypothetical protein